VERYLPYKRLHAHILSLLAQSSHLTRCQSRPAGRVRRSGARPPSSSPSPRSIPVIRYLWPAASDASESAGKKPTLISWDLHASNEQAGGNVFSLHRNHPPYRLYCRPVPAPRPTPIRRIRPDSVCTAVTLAQVIAVILAPFYCLLLFRPDKGGGVLRWACLSVCVRVCFTIRYEMLF